MTFSSVDFVQNIWHLTGEHRAGPKCPGWLQLSALLLLTLFTALNCPASEISLLDQSLHLLPPRLPACPLHSCEGSSSAPPCRPGLSAVLLAHPSANQTDTMWSWTVCVCWCGPERLSSLPSPLLITSLGAGVVCVWGEVHCYPLRFLNTLAGRPKTIHMCFLPSAAQSCLAIAFSLTCLFPVAPPKAISPAVFSLGHQWTPSSQKRVQRWWKHLICSASASFFFLLYFFPLNLHCFLCPDTLWKEELLLLW